MFSKFRKLLDKTSEKISEKVGKKEIKEEDIEEILWEMQLELLEENVALEVAENIINTIKKELLGKVISKKEIKKIIYKKLEEIIRNSIKTFELDKWIYEQEDKPLVLVFFGFNGTGKTTTIAKLGKYLRDKEKSVVFAAGDTFRSAAIEQLEEHGRKLNIKVIKQRYGSDPAAVIYDAINYARSKGIDTVLADTAGRAPTDRNLIEELKKIVRVAKPHLKLLVVESISGNNIIEQARLFNQVGIDAIILTKYDADDKRGSVLSICHTLNKPVAFVGTGQEYDDLKKFNISQYIKEVLGREND